VNIKLPMANLQGDYVLNGKPGKVTCAAAEMVMAITLDLKVHDGQATYADGTPLPPPEEGTKRHKFVPKTQSTNPREPVAALSHVNFLKPLSDPEAHDILVTAVLDWCNKNMAEFAHVFAILDLYQSLPSGDFAFCKPMTASYAYVDQPGQHTGYFAVLAMTTDRPDPNAQEIDAAAVPDGCDAAFLLGERRFMLDMLAPALTKQWPNLTADLLQLSADGVSLTMQSGHRIELPDRKDKKSGDTYTPVLIAFEAELKEDEIRVDLHTEVEVSPGIYATCASSNWFKLSLDKNPVTGGSVLKFTEPRQGTKEQGKRVEPWVSTLDKVMEWVGIGALILSSVVDDGVSLALAAAAITMTIGHVIINRNEDAALDIAPALDDLVKNMVAPFHWTDKDLTPHTGGLNGAFQLGGHWT
jgi:hypothetical protein